MSLDAKDRTLLKNLSRYSARRYYTLLFIAGSGSSALFYFEMVAPLQGTILFLSGLLAGFSIERIYTISMTDRFKKILDHLGIDPNRLT